jgi:hypothetical protein
MADPAVSLAASEAVEDSTRSTASSASAPRVAAGNAGVPGSIAGQEDPSNPPPPLEALPPAAPGNAADRSGVPNAAAVSPDQAAPLPSAALPSAEQPETSGTNGAGAEPSETPLTPEEERNLHLFMRFLRGYPALVRWFPKHLGPPRAPRPPDSPLLCWEPIDFEWAAQGFNGPSYRGAGGGAERGPARAGETGGGGGYESPTSRRRTPPSPWDSPPFPVSEYQGYPLIGVPPSPNEDPLQKALYLGPHGDAIKDSRIEVHGWVTAGGNWSNAHRSNLPTAYWIVPNSLELDQAVIKLEREVDWAQEDHIDWGFRSTHLYGIDYRYTTSGGWLSQQLLYHNNLYGYDPVELYFELYIPRVFEGMVVRVGRWIACPDIETQYAPDNYLATHSLLFTYDTYTQTGCMFSFQLNPRNMVQGAIQAGTDMAPWYPGALATGFFGWRWVAEDNNNAFYTCLNNINNARFRYFDAHGQKSGHDNFNYIVTTWEHRFNRKVHTKTEAYYMWQIDAVLGGTPSLGPVMSFGGGGGLGKFIPGTSRTYGVLNYTMFAVSRRDYFTVRNEWWRDEQGERSGFPSNYSSHTIGLSHQFSDLVMIRPEIGFYHSYDVPAFDLGKNKNLLMYGFDFTVRF